MKSIRAKLWIAMMSLVAIVLILLWFFQIVFLDNYYTKAKVDDIITAGSSLLEVLQSGDEVSFQENLDEWVYNNNLTAELVDRDFNVRYSAGESMASGRMPMMRNNLRQQAYEQIFRGQIVTYPMAHPRFNSQFMLIGLPLNISGTTQGALLLTLPLAPVEDAVGILKGQLIYITIILLLATLLLTYLLARNFSKPIREITQTSTKLAAGDLTARSQTIRKDEIGKLADTINYLGQELNKIEQLRKELIANISHELRTPLSLIKGYAETIRDVSGDNPEKRERQLGIIIEEADRLSLMVGDILDYSQIEAGFSSIELNQFRIDEMLTRVVQNFTVLREMKGVTINLESNCPVLVEADEKRIEQVLYNLLKNALNHSPKGSLIKVVAAECTAVVRIEIRDQGSGIPEGDKERIWERFYQGNQTGEGKKSGTGLGLAIVKSTLSAHNFSFGVESQVGQGATFWFELKKAVSI